MVPMPGISQMNRRQAAARMRPGMRLACGGVFFSIAAACHALECPENFIPGAANSTMGVYCDFCVAKYEQKIAGRDNGDIPYDSNYIAECRASGIPWKNLTMPQALEECEALGAGYTLSANPEWMTIARNIESVGRRERAEIWPFLSTPHVHKLPNGNWVPIPGGERVPATIGERVHTNGSDHPSACFRPQVWIAAECTEMGAS